MKWIWQSIPEWLHNQKLGRIDSSSHPDYDGQHTDIDNIVNAQIIYSETKDGKHRPILDIDFPVHIEPSATEGHYHLYLDKEMNWETYEKLLRALRDAGIIEYGYYYGAMARGHSAVRLPWRKKGKWEE